MCRTTKDYRAPGAIARLPGEKWADFNARQIAHRAENTPKPKPKRKRVSRAKAEANSRKKVADRIDGYDRDDIGLSPDF